MIKIRISPLASDLYLYLSICHYTGRTYVRDIQNQTEEILLIKT